MGKAVERWIADDGAEFDNKKDMLVHELTLLDEKEIDLFLSASVSSTSKRGSEYKKLLIQWQKHLRSQELSITEAISSAVAAEVENPLN